MSCTQEGKLKDCQDLRVQLESEIIADKNVGILKETESASNSSEKGSKEVKEPLYIDRI